jgi:hypothetical protein
MPLPDVLIQRLGPQPIREGSVGAVPARSQAARNPSARHFASRPITSTPAGGVKVNKSSANFAFREVCMKVNCVT